MAAIDVLSGEDRYYHLRLPKKRLSGAQIEKLKQQAASMMRRRGAPLKRSTEIKRELVRKTEALGSRPAEILRIVNAIGGWKHDSSYYNKLLRSIHTHGHKST